jgi:kumamolisin
VQHGCNGTGTTVADVIDSPIVPSDLAAYLSASGVTETGTVTDVPVDGGATETYDNVETSLDVETIAGLAPGANIRIYDMPDLSLPYTLDAYNQVVSENLASVVNSSFGGCEDQFATVSFTTDSNAIAEQGAAKGITFVAASGNLGSNECTDFDIETGVQSPSGDPYFVSVGGDNFTVDPYGNLLTLTATGGPTGFQSGGGVSDQFPLPSYQSGVANVITSGRNQPDVSLPGVGVAIYSGGGNYGGADGTAWASASFTALLAGATQIANTRFGWANPAIYTVFYDGGYTYYFTDVTVGSNGLYNAMAGYDQVTGLGAPKGFFFAQVLGEVQ